MDTPHILWVICSSIQPPSREKENSYIWIDFPVFGLCPLPVARSLGKNLVLYLLKSLYTLVRYPWALSSPGWTFPHLSTSSHTLGTTSPQWPSWPFTGLTLVYSYHSSDGEPRYGHSAPDVSYQCWAEGKDLLVVPCLKQPRILLAFFATKAHCWLIFNLVSTRNLIVPSEH